MLIRSAILVISLISLLAQADDVSGVSSNITELGPIKVIGSSQEELTQPNSAHFVSKEKLEQQQQTDVNRVLKQVPGVYVREEDGFGLRPNIGLRGTHPDRSKKIVLLEDGILIGPAPYSAPAAYYTPFMSKIESLEVFKGVASVPFGPNSIGGVINYLTRSIPQANFAELDIAGGNFNTQKYRGHVARVWDNGGIMFEGTQLQTDGYKELDTDDTTGFKKNDFLVKGQHRLGGEIQHELQWKVGYGDEVSDETYLGLSFDDFDNNPYRRYAASAKDQMDWQHEQYQLTYKAQPSEGWALWATGYFHKFHRNWTRFDGFRNSAIKINSVLLNPNKDAINQLYYSVIRGESNSSDVGAGADLVILNNDRNFYSQGLQFGSFSVHSFNDWTHQLSLGLRLHEDQIHRNHTSDIYSLENKQLIRTSDQRTQKDKNTDNAKAVSVTASDEMSWQALKVTLMSRFESVSYTSQDELNSTNSSGTENIFVPGIGSLYQFNERWSALLGVNKGLTVIGPGQTQSSKPEESINYEGGVRYSNPDLEFLAEAIAFYVDYQNIKGTCTFSAGCSGASVDQEFDGGKARISGLESRFAKGFQWNKIYLPISLSMTLTDAKFASTTATTNAEWGGPGTINSGDPLPYVPKAQYTLGLGTQYKKYSQEVLLTWTGEMYDQSIAVNTEGDERKVIPAHGVVDWTAKYMYQPQGQVYARIDNILDNEYLVSLRPYGARPGKARSFMVGIKHGF